MKIWGPINYSKNGMRSKVIKIDYAIEIISTSTYLFIPFTRGISIVHSWKRCHQFQCSEDAFMLWCLFPYDLIPSPSSCLTRWGPSSPSWSLNLAAQTLIRWDWTRLHSQSWRWLLSRSWEGIELPSYWDAPCILSEKKTKNLLLSRTVSVRKKYEEIAIDEPVTDALLW